eukprot:12621067-Ditylum_brightwellii.AAC.1
MGRDAPFPSPKKNHSGTDLPPTIFRPTNKSATTTTSKSATTKHKDKRNNQPSIASPVKRRHFCSNKNRQKHRNRQTHRNHHNPNFEPALKWFEKERGRKAVNYKTINKMVKKVLHHGQRAKRKQQLLTKMAAILGNIFLGDLQFL